MDELLPLPSAASPPATPASGPIPAAAAFAGNTLAAANAQAPGATPAPPARRRKRRRRLGIILASLTLVAIAAGSGLLLRGRNAEGPDADEPRAWVKRGPISISFTERGTIKALHSEQIFSTLEGSRTIVSVVPEGAYVKKGDLLVELDSSELTQLYNQQAIAVETAKAAYLSAEEALKIQQLQNESDLTAAELTVELAKIDKKKYEEGDYPQAVEKAESEIVLNELEHDRAMKKLVKTDELARKGYVTNSDFIADKIAAAKAKVMSEQAEKAKKVLNDYTHLKDSLKIKTDLEQADRARRRIELKTASLLAQAEADHKSKEQTYKLSLRRLEKIKEQIEKTRIIAPQDGMVIYHQDGRFGREDRMIEQGATVRENQHLIDLPDLSVMAVSVQVPEARIHQLKLDLRATISIDAQDNLAFRGKVTRIGLLPDYVNRWLNPDLKVYLTDITIDPDEDTRLLRPGMSAKCEIMVEEIPEALFIPVQSVTTIDGSTHSYRFHDGVFTAQHVELGPSNDSFAVVLAGLQEGDEVKLNAPRPQGTPPSQKKGKDAVEGGSGKAGADPAAAKGEAGGERSRRGKRKGEGPADPAVPVEAAPPAPRPAAPRTASS